MQVRTSRTSQNWPIGRKGIVPRISERKWYVFVRFGDAPAQPRWMRSEDVDQAKPAFVRHVRERSRIRQQPVPAPLLRPRRVVALNTVNEINKADDAASRRIDRQRHSHLVQEVPGAQVVL